MGILRWLGYLLLAFVGVIALLFLLARFHDGPLTMIPGGPLRHGDLVSEAEVDWTFATDVPEIELQLVSQSRSRTVWIVVADGKAYIPASLDFPPLKSWHERAVEDGRAILRVEGKRYQRRLVKIDDAALESELGKKLIAKYQIGESGPGANPDSVWIFRIDPES